MGALTGCCVCVIAAFEGSSSGHPGPAPGPWSERRSSLVSVSAPLGFGVFDELQLQLWVSLGSALREFPLGGCGRGDRR